MPRPQDRGGPRTRARAALGGGDPGAGGSASGLGPGVRARPRHPEPRLGQGHVASRDQARLRPVFKSSMWKMGAALGRFELSKGIWDLRPSN